MNTHRVGMIDPMVECWCDEPESWRFLPDNCAYMVSDHGRVFSLYTRKLMTGIVHNGYSWLVLPMRTVGIDHKANKAIHRLVLEAFVGPAPEHEECAHGDGNPGNNHLDNLRWATRKENQADRKKNGTFIHGELSKNAKLNWENVRWIRKNYIHGHKDKGLAALAGRFGVTKAAIRQVAIYSTWKYDPLDFGDVPE